MQAAGPRLLVAAGADGILTSANGGTTWVHRRAIRGPVRQVDVVSPRVWLAVTQAALFRTTDGGRHWRPLQQPASGPVFGADFWSPDAGVAQTVQGTFVTTRDSGATWLPLRLPAGWSLQSGGLEHGPPGPISVCFGANGTGWAIAARDGRRDVLVSADGGDHWRVALSHAGLDIASCAGRTGWVSVTRATSRYYNHPAYDLLRSTNDGRSWLDVLRAGPSGVSWPPAAPFPPGGATRAPSGHTYSVLQPLSLASAGAAWYTLVNQYGNGLGIGETDNAGLSWSTRWFAQSKPLAGSPPPRAWLATAALSSRRAFLLFGEPKESALSYLYGTSNAGATWQLVSVFRPAAA